MKRKNEEQYYLREEVGRERYTSDIDNLSAAWSTKIFGELSDGNRMSINVKGAGAKTTVAMYESLYEKTCKQ